MRNRSPWITVALLSGVIVLFVLSFAFGRQSHADEPFAGTDSVVTDTLAADHGVQPWFTPVFEPGSGEIESGLFALQAALGAGVLGFALGNLRGRSVAARQAAAPPAGPDAASGQPTSVADAALPGAPVASAASPASDPASATDPA